MYTSRVSLLELSRYLTDVVGLVQCNVFGRRGDTEAYHESGRAEVCDPVRFVHMAAESINKRLGSCRMENIVHNYGQHRPVISTHKEEDTGITQGLLVPQRGDLCTQVLIKQSWRLLEAIYSFVTLQHTVGRQVNPLGNAHIDSLVFRQNTI